MQIGISLTPNGNRNTDPREAVRHLVWAANYADEHDFDIVWSTEHHFTPVAFSSSPSVILSHYAAVTSRVKLGYAVAILPFHHPVRLAEDMAWLDNLSGGRLIAGASPGWSPFEFSAFDVPLEERRERFLEGMTILRKALTGQPFSHEGRFWHVPELRIMPPPIQAELPFVSATTSAEGLVMTAKLRMSPLLGMERPHLLAEQVTQYVAALRDDGAEQAEIADLQSRLGSLRRVIIRDTDEQAEEEAMEAVMTQRRVSNQAHNVDANTGQPVEGILRRRNNDVEEDPRKTYAFGGTLFGSPETVARKLVELREVGLGHAVLQFHTTTRDTDGVKDNIRRFATEVLPAYRAATREKQPVGVS